MNVSSSKTKPEIAAGTGDFLASATAALAAAGIASARLDCLVLLEDALGMDRARLLAHPETAIPQDKLDILNTFIVQRQKHVPLAYIRGKGEFYGRVFAVNEHVLVPRPETEAVIDLAKKLPLPARHWLADIGTGSGCIGITAALELPGSTVDLYDIDQAALAVAKSNAGAHDVPAGIHEGDLLASVATHYDCLLANLPYVPENYPVNADAGFEPRIALFAGQDGMDCYRRFWQQITRLPEPPEFVVTESMADQHAVMNLLADAAGYRLTDTAGLAQSYTFNR